MQKNLSHDDGGARPQRGRFFGLIRALCLFYAAFVICQNVLDITARAHLVPTGDKGAAIDATGHFDNGFVLIKSVKPGGAMAKAGVAAGDQVRFDNRIDYRRWLHVNEPVGFTLRHAGGLSHHELIALPRTGDVNWLNLAYSIGGAFGSLFGAFILWRSRNVTTLLLGVALTAYGATNIMPPVQESDPRVATYFLMVNIASYALISVLFYAFALSFYRDHVGPMRAAHRVGFWIYAAVEASVVAFAFYCFIVVQTFPIVGNGQTIQFLAVFTGLALSLTYLAVGWRKSAAGVQQRYALMLVALGMMATAQMYDSLRSFDARFETEAGIIAITVLAALGAPALLTYAILRRKVFDLGFAVNRTLVYGVVSAILLAAFGLVEWAVDHLVPIEGREKNALVDAAIALGVFLTFHRVRDVVEHGVERVFFRSWQEAEAGFRKFVKEAAFITDGTALAKNTARALSKYAEGAEAAIYLVDGTGFTRVAGDVSCAAERLDANATGLLSVRANLKPAEVHEGDLDGCLIAPMMTRNEVAGVAVLGPKPSGLSYRPDEIDLVAWGTHQVGLDLYALKVEALEKERASLQTANAQLERLLRPDDVSPSRQPA
jgi:hypothetical protein